MSGNAEAAVPTVDLDTLWYIHGRAYDLTQFLKRHPGGQQVLLDVRGQDCTELFDSMHSDVTLPLRMLAKLEEVSLPEEVLQQRFGGAAQPQEQPQEQQVIEEVTERVVLHQARPLSEAPAAVEIQDKQTVGVDDPPSVDPSSLWYLHGRAYDLSDFINKHPGGRHALLWTQGRDCTAMFESYHAFTDRPAQLLATLKEVKLPEAVLRERVRDVSYNGWFYLPDGKTPDPLWATLKQRCRQRLKELGVPHTMSWTDFLFMWWLAAVFVAIYYWGYLSLNLWVAVACTPVLGLLAWMLVRLGHDGSHCAASRMEWLNRVCAWVGFVTTSNPVYWDLLHNVLHHVETNTLQDPDLYHYTVFLRLHPDYPTKSLLHRLQLHRLWVYWIWSFTVIGLCVEEPMRMLLTGSGTNPAAPGTRLAKNRWSFWAALVAHYLLYWFLGLWLPYYIRLSHSSGRVADVAGLLLLSGLVFVVYMRFAGLFFGLCSQVNHLSEGLMAAGSKGTSWAQLQVETAANHGWDSRLSCYLAAGVNIQIEHHLFPSLSAERLRLLCPVVQEVCREFGVQYTSLSFGQLIESTHRHLEALARDQFSQPSLTAPPEP